MQYDYSVQYNNVQGAWQLNWSSFDPERPHQMKGDVVICDSLDEAIETLRGFVAQHEPSRLDDVV
jgi:hypothetical protein